MHPVADQNAALHSPLAHGAANGAEASEGHEHEPGLTDLLRIILVAAMCVAMWAGKAEHSGLWITVAVLVALIGGYPIFHEALENLLARRMTMELSMSLAIGAALVIREGFTALVIVLFVLIAEVLEGLTVERGRRAIGRLLDRLPDEAVVRAADGSTRTVRRGEVRAGEVLLVRPGARIPVDGAVVAGHSFVDESAITGEPVPVEKVPGQAVFAGSINQSGTIDVRTERMGADTAFGRIIEAVERAEKSRAPVEKVADRYAGYLVYLALACAALTGLVTHDARSTISVVIVAGACGIAAGTPLAILGAVGRAAAGGVIVKGGIHLEGLAAVDTVVFDKTGTLTLGLPVVTDVSPVAGVGPEDLVVCAATAERPSEHPFAKAILARAGSMSLSVPEPSRFDYAPGQGITCTAGGARVAVGSRSFLAAQGIDLHALPSARPDASEVCVARDGRALGSLRIEDQVRAHADRVVRELRAMGLRTVLLTGDADSVAKAVGGRLGIDESTGDLLPDRKVARIEALRAQGRSIAMVGDGINDAPALMAANVGVAMGSGTDVARESADVVLLGGELLKLVEVLELAHRCRGIIRFNFIGTLAVDGLGVALAAFGLLNPLLAAFIHVSSELAFILNSARLVPGAASRSRRVEPAEEA